MTLSTAVMDTGPGAYTIMRQIVGEEIKVPLDSIKVEILDTTKVVKTLACAGAAAPESTAVRLRGGQKGARKSCVPPRRR